MAIKIEFNGLWQEMPLSKEESLLFFEQVCLLHKIEDISFEILICDDKESRKLNKAYLNANSPTNVLSFPEGMQARDLQNHEINISVDEEKEIADSDEQIDSNNAETNFIGSLALSVETLEREAFLYGQERKDYAKQLLIHGFAHLLGYDHSEEMDDFCDSCLD